jgi:hypothetical protein
MMSRDIGKRHSSQERSFSARISQRCIIHGWLPNRVQQRFDDIEVETRTIGGEIMTLDPNTLLALSDLTEKDRIQILLAEYGALKAEVLGRTSFGFQIAAVAFAAVTWFLQQPLTGKPWYFWPGMVAVIASFCIAVFVNQRDLSRAAYRIKELEHEVNSRAGESLLVWETLGSVVTRMGLAESLFRTIKTLPRSELPPLDPIYLERDQAFAKKKAPEH